MRSKGAEIEEAIALEDWAVTGLRPGHRALPPAGFHAAALASLR